MKTRLFLKLFLICVLSSASLQARAATTPLNELTNPDERALYCKAIVGTSLTTAAARNRGSRSQQGVADIMQTMQTIKSWEKEITRLYPTRAAQREFTKKASAHHYKHMQAYMKKASVNQLDAQAYLVGQDLKNCDKELVSYQKRTLPVPVVAEKRAPTHAPKAVVQKEEARKEVADEKPVNIAVAVEKQKPGATAQAAKKTTAMVSSEPEIKANESEKSPARKAAERGVVQVDHESRTENLQARIARLSTLFIGAWEGTAPENLPRIKKRDIELAIWSLQEGEEDFSAPEMQLYRKILINDNKYHRLRYAGYLHTKDGRCNTYLRGKSAPVVYHPKQQKNGLPESYVTLGLYGRTDIQENFKKCKGLLSISLKITVGAMNTVKIQTGGREFVIKRKSASDKLYAAAAKGRPESGSRNPKAVSAYMTKSVPTAAELSVIKDKSRVYPAAVEAIANFKKPVEIKKITVYPGPDLYQSDKLNIRAGFSTKSKDDEVYKKALQKWCATEKVKKGHTVAATYNAEHNERRKLFASDYEAFIETKVHPAIKKLCGRQTTFIRMNMRKKGESQNWDTLAFRLKNGSVYKSMQRRVSAPKKYKTVEDTLKPGERRTLAKHEIWHILCEKGPFCGLAGGLYLNAIYKNDVELLKMLDRRFNTYVKDKLSIKDSEIGWDKIGLGFGKIYSDQSIMVGVADKYMHGYKAKFNSCLKPDARSKTYTYEVKPTHWETLSGMYAGSTPGYKVSATYTVNPELFPLVLKIGNHNGGRWWAHSYDTLGSKAASYTIEGLVQLQNKFSCNSAEVKQFEKNLLRLTERYLKDPKAWHAGKKKL